MPVREFLKDVPEEFFKSGVHCETVFDLIAALQKLPPYLPVGDLFEGVELSIANAMKEHDHVSDEDVYLEISDKF